MAATAPSASFERRPQPRRLRRPPRPVLLTEFVASAAAVVTDEFGDAPTAKRLCT